MKETKENADLWITVITPLNRLYIFSSNSVVKKYKIAVFFDVEDFGSLWWFWAILALKNRIGQMLKYPHWIRVLLPQASPWIISFK